MKKLPSFLILLGVTGLFSFASCRKTDTKPEPEPEPTNEQEIITTVQFFIWDSITGNPVPGSPFVFRDLDGEGGQAGSFLENGADSLINILATRSYNTKVLFLDESKSPIDTISNAVAGEESYEHMVFYNGNPSMSGTNKGNTVIKSGYPLYTVELNQSKILLRYLDADNGAAKGKATLCVGLRTHLKAGNEAVQNFSFPFIITLRHQPDAKDGSYAPGETDVEVPFKIRVY